MSPKMLKFFEFIYDRQSLLYVKNNSEKGVTNWTADPILREFKFCNVRRRDDACTQVLIREVIDNRKLKPADILANVIMFRFFNFRTFFQEITPPIQVKDFNFKDLEKRFDDAKGRGVTLYNLAYRICTAVVDKNYRRQDKHVQLLLSIQKSIGCPFYQDLLRIGDMKRFCELVTAVKFVGPFLAYQIALDWHYFKPFCDSNEFVDVGPGAIEGVDFIFGKKHPQGATYEDCCRRLQRIQNDAFNELKKKRGKDWANLTKLSGWVSPEIALSDIENCLCEYRKYFKLKHNMVTRHRKYNP